MLGGVGAELRRPLGVSIVGGLLLGYSALSPADLAEAGRRLAAVLADVPPAR